MTLRDFAAPGCPAWVFDDSLALPLETLRRSLAHEAAIRRSEGRPTAEVEWATVEARVAEVEAYLAARASGPAAMPALSVAAPAGPGRQVKPRARKGKHSPDAMRLFED